MTLAGSLFSLIYLSHSITIHVIIGVLFMVMMLLHLFQRRRTIKALRNRLMRMHAGTGPRARLAISDMILELLALNVLVSGGVDILKHHVTQFPLAAALHLTPGLDQWHKIAAIVFVMYAIVHVTRRRTRLRRSHIQ